MNALTGRREFLWRLGGGLAVQVVEQLAALGCQHTAYPYPHAPLDTLDNVKRLASQLWSTLCCPRVLRRMVIAIRVWHLYHSRGRKEFTVSARQKHLQKSFGNCSQYRER